MWDWDDVQRSLRWYTALALGSPPWDIRTERVEVRDDARPAAVVEPSSPIVPRLARATVPQGNILEDRSFAAVAYPVLGETVEESKLEAARVESALDAMVRFGLVNDDGTDISAPSYLPVWDFAGVALTDEFPTLADTPYDHAVIAIGANVQRQQDNVELRRFTVILNLRVEWERPGRVSGVDVPLAAGGVVPQSSFPNPGAP